MSLGDEGNRFAFSSDCWPLLITYCQLHHCIILIRVNLCGLDSSTSILFLSILLHNSFTSLPSRSILSMPLNLDANGCGIIRKHVYCPNNITEIYYDGHIRPSRDCTLDTCSLLVSNWGYLPNAPSNIFFAVVFGVFFILHIPLGLWKRTWGVLLGMTIGSSLEAVGYVGRTIAHSQPFSFNPFLIYIIFLTTAPAFLCAAIYVCLARIIVVYGESNARFRPTTYSIIFMFSDFIALVLQGAGGGLASVNSGKDQQKAQMGINIMIAGLAWQVVSLTLFTVAAADFVWCVKKGRGQPNQDFMALRQAKKFRAFMWCEYFQSVKTMLTA